MKKLSLLIVTTALFTQQISSEELGLVALGDHAVLESLNDSATTADQDSANLVELTDAVPSIPHPNDLAYAELDWQIPDGAGYRSEYNGIPLYYADQSLPLFVMKIVFEAGPLYGKGENGVSTLYPSILKNGGTANYSPSEIDSILTLNAINIGVNTSKTEVAVTVSGLADQFEYSVELLDEIFSTPQFNRKRLKQYKSSINQQITHRFDEPAPVMKIAGEKLLYPGSVLANLITEDDINSVTRGDLQQFHTELLTEAPMTIAFAGAVEQERVEAAIEELFPEERNVIEPTINAPEVAPTHDFIIIQKPINQAYILIGQPLFQRPDERYYPLTLFNAILGGGGFNSRLVTEVRSNAGLTYSISSGLNAGYYYDGAFTVSLFTKSESVNHGVALTIQTIEETLAEDLTDEEINGKKIEFISSLPSSFRSGSDIVGTYQNNEVMGRSMDHYLVYPDKLNAITTEEVITTARETLDPEQFKMVIVGDTTELFNAPEWNGFDIKDLNPTIMTVEELLHYNDEIPTVEQ